MTPEPSGDQTPLSPSPELQRRYDEAVRRLAMNIAHAAAIDCEFLPGLDAADLRYGDEMMLDGYGLLTVRRVEPGLTGEFIVIGQGTGDRVHLRDGWGWRHGRRNDVFRPLSGDQT